MSEQTDREALAERLRHYASILRSDMDDPWTARDVEAAAEVIATQPQPHVVETVEALSALDPSLVLVASGRHPGDRGTFHRCHVRRLPEFITGSTTPLFEVLIYGDAGHHNLVGVEDIDLPAIVLTPATQVHSHGTEEGDGLGCRETRLTDGRLIGSCLMPTRPTASEPTAAQVEAAAREICANHRDPDDDMGVRFPAWRLYLNDARAALTAAAKVGGGR